MGTSRVNGAALRVIRERSDLSISDVVGGVREAGIDVHPDHLRNIELGHKQPSPKLLAAIARALKCPKAALYADEQVPA